MEEMGTLRACLFPLRCLLSGVEEENTHGHSHTRIPTLSEITNLWDLK